MSLSIHGQIVTPSSIQTGHVIIYAGQIIDIDFISDGKKADYVFSDAYIVPGFIDVHMHGQGNYGVFDAEDIIEIAKNQPKYGTTGFIPTAASLAEEKYIKFISDIRQAKKLNRPSAANILGAHLEGPFINPLRKGGMDANFLRLPDISECQRYIDAADDVLKIMTLSPELKGAELIIRKLKNNDIIVSLGHSSANVQEFKNAFQNGLNHVCHLFNAFERTTGSPDKWPWQTGLIEAILDNKHVTVELICDLQHVSLEHIRFAVKKCGIDRIVAITDSMQGAGLPPGVYKMLDGRQYSTDEGIAKLTSNGTIVGSVLTMDNAFKNLVKVCGLDIVTVSKFTSTNPAKLLGLDRELGTIEPGKYADLTVLDSDFKCIATFIKGENVFYEM